MAKDFDFAALEAALSDPATTTESLRGIVESAGLAGPFKPGDIFPIGIVAPDAVRSQLDVQPNALPGLIEALRTSHGVRSWRVFPLGIVAPDRFAVQVDVGRRFKSVGGE